MIQPFWGRGDAHHAPISLMQDHGFIDPRVHGDSIIFGNVVQ